MGDTVIQLNESKPLTDAGRAPAAEPAIRVEGVRKRYGDLEVLKASI